MDMKRLRDLLITVLGLWLMLAPRFLHFPVAHVDATWNTWIVGAAIILRKPVIYQGIDNLNRVACKIRREQKIKVLIDGSR